MAETRPGCCRRVAASLFDGWLADAYSVTVVSNKNVCRKEKETRMNKGGKLKGKDLINIGIYAAIYCVIMTAVAMLGFIPIMMPILCVLVPLLGNDPYLRHDRGAVPVDHGHGILAVHFRRRVWFCGR